MGDASEAFHQALTKSEKRKNSNCGLIVQSSAISCINSILEDEMKAKRTQIVSVQLQALFSNSNCKFIPFRRIPNIPKIPYLEPHFHDLGNVTLGLS